ncbi:MAG: GNAT family N-acetyltransferase [Ignavibacteria bacterium]|nr:GNAT family N-acetyltransferase [Ignavibacteria bacterium]
MNHLKASFKEIFRNLPALETERLRLRKLSLRDATDIYEYASSPEVSEHVSWEYHRDISDSVRFLRTIVQQYESGLPSPWGIVLKNERKLIGTIGFHTYSPENFYGEIGYALSNRYWNNGYMTEAFKEVLRFGFEVLKLNRIEATCKPMNIRSERVMIKCGLKFEGLLRQRLFTKNSFHDLKIFSILKSEYFKL